MSRPVKLRLRMGSMRELRTQPETVHMLEDVGRNIYNTLPNAEEDYSYYNTEGKNRRRVNIVTATYQSRKDNAKNATLLTALGRGSV